MRGRRLHWFRGTLAAAVAALCISAGSAGASVMPTMIKEFPIDFDHPSGLESIAVGAGGDVWFGSYWWPDGSYHASIGRMDLAGGFDEFDQGLAKHSSISALAPGPDGNVWFASEVASVGKIAPDGTITAFTAGLGGSQPRTIFAGPDGNLWFTGSEGSPTVGFVTTDGEITAYHLPDPVWDGVAGPDGNIWFTYGGDGAPPAIGRLVMQEDGGAVVTLFHSGLAAGSRPREIVSSQNGYLWFTDRGDSSGAIGRVSMSGEISEFGSLGPDGVPSDIAAGPTGDVWFTDREGDDVGRVTPAGQLTLLAVRHLVEPRYIVAGADGNMWFTHWGGIGKVAPSGAVTSLRDGLDPSASPEEIVSAPDGRLWFLSGGFSYSAIGRITPGNDDGRPPDPKDPPESFQPPLWSGKLSLQGKTFGVSRRGRTVFPVACLSASQCVGKLRLLVFSWKWKAGRQIGASSFSIDPWGQVGVRMQLNRVGRKLLEKGGPVRARLMTAPGRSPAALHESLRLRLAKRP